MSHRSSFTLLRSSLLGAGMLAMGAAWAADAPASGQGSDNPTFPIDLAPLTAKADARFERLDQSGDGKITLEAFLSADRRDLHGVASERVYGGRGGAREHRMHGRRGADAGSHERQGWMARRAERRSGNDRAEAAERRDRYRAQRVERQADWQQRLFSALDTDGDGQLSAAEFAALPDVREQLHREALFERLDQNNDGVLDRSEFPPRIARLEAMDLDGDGQVTRDEMRRYMAERRDDQRRMGRRSRD